MKENGMIRLNAASAEDLAAFRENGYVAFPAVLTDEGLKGLLDEILSREQIEYFRRCHAVGRVVLHLRQVSHSWRFYITNGEFHGAIV